MAISDWASLLSSGETTVPEVVSRLGQPVAKQTRAGYRFAAVGSRIRGMWLGIDVAADGAESPRYLEVTFDADGAPLAADLEREFGSPMDLPGEPGGDVRLARFRYEREDHPFVAFVFAALSQPAADAAAKVLEITIRREERL
jgi:hypothetical protein